tara:strand:+ start:476 stop:1153 length:678 start_codon:yes stop_codon:yes gene_type:complete
MKINKSQLLKIINEEVKKILQEADTSSFVAAGDEAARRREREMEDDPVGDFLGKTGGVDVATDMLAKAAGELEKAGKTQTMDFSDKPMDIVAKKPRKKRRGSRIVKRMQKALMDAGYDVGPAGNDGLPGKATLAAYNEMMKDLDSDFKDINLAQLKATLKSAAGVGGPMLAKSATGVKAMKMLLGGDIKELQAVKDVVAGLGGKASKENLLKMMAVASGEAGPGK